MFVRPIDRGVSYRFSLTRICSYGVDVLYGAGHLVTTTFGQWPIWPGRGKQSIILNIATQLFAVKNNVSHD